MNDLAWASGTRIVGRPNSRGDRTEPGYVLETGVLRGDRVAYVLWSSPRPGFASGTAWLDTIPVSAIIRVVAA